MLGNIPNNAAMQIKKHEGLRLKPYRCTADKLTIGYGRNLDDAGISEREATLLLEDDVMQCYDDMFRVFKDFETFLPSRQVALIDMRFNLGPARFRNFKKMISWIKKGNWIMAAAEALDSRWYSQVGIRAQRVVSQLRGP